MLTKIKQAKADGAKALQDARDKADRRLQAAGQAAEKRLADMQFKPQTEIAGLQDTLKAQVAITAPGGPVARTAAAGKATSGGKGRVHINGSRRNWQFQSGKKNCDRDS